MRSDATSGFIVMFEVGERVVQIGLVLFEETVDVHTGGKAE